MNSGRAAFGAMVAQCQLPVLGLISAGIGMHHDRAVRLDHDQPQRLWKERLQAAGVADFTASNDQAHRGNLTSTPDAPLTVRIQLTSQAETTSTGE